MRWWPFGRGRGPRGAWLELPTGERVRMVAVYRGRDHRRIRQWELLLDGVDSVVIPADSINLMVDEIPVGSTGISIAMEPVADGYVKIYGTDRKDGS